MSHKLTLKINDRFKNRQVDFFNEFSMNLAHNQIASSFEVKFFFDPNNPAHKELACVSHFHEFTMEFNDQLIITGFILSNQFRVSSTKEMASISGYSKPGVLEDCEIPPTLYPLQSNGLSLKQIATKIVRPFKLNIEINPAVADRMNKTFSGTTAGEGQNIKSFLAELAKQKNIIMSHNVKGDLLFTETKADSEPVLDFDLTNGIDSMPGTTFTFNFNGQGMHSHIYVQKQAGIDGGNAGQKLIRNPYVPVVFRPTTISQSSGDDNDTDLAARRALANELRNIKLTITTDRWEINEKMLLPNTIITIFAPELYIYVKTRFLIESIDYVGNESVTTATLNCVLPEVYTNEIPKSIFAGINLYPQPHI